MIPKWYPGYYLDPQHWPEWMPEVFPHWLPASLVRTPPAIPPEPATEPSSKPSFSLYDGLTEQLQPKSFEERLAALPFLLPPKLPDPSAASQSSSGPWGGLLPRELGSQPAPWPDAATAASLPPLFPRWPDYVQTTSGVPAKIAGWPWDVPGDVSAQPVQWPSSSASTFSSMPYALPAQRTAAQHTPDADWAAIEALVNAPNPGIPRRAETVPVGRYLGVPLDTIVSGVQGVYHAITDPIPAYGDREAMIERAVPLAMLGVGGGMPFAPRNAAGTFGGRLAVTADRAALARAEEMARRGASRDEILAETGWLKDRDGNWQFEMNDRGARFVGQYGQQPYSRDLPHAVKHEELFDAYPDLAQVQTRWDVRTREGLATSGSYEPVGRRGESISVTAPGRREAISAYLHEIQHAVNKREGFSRGGSPESTLSPEARTELFSKRELLGDILQEARRPGNAGWLDGLTFTRTGEISGQPRDVMGQMILALHRRVTQLERDAFEGYRMQPSEIMARNVQKRMTMTPLERLRHPPWETEGKWGLTTAEEFPFIRGRTDD